MFSGGFKSHMFSDCFKSHKFSDRFKSHMFSDSFKSHMFSDSFKSHMFSDSFKSHVLSDSFKSHMFCSVITFPGWSAAVSEIPAYSLWCDRRLVNIFVPVPLSVQELPNIQVYGGEGSHILRQCKGWFTPQYISAVSCAHSDIKEAVGGKCNKKDSNDAYTR